MTTPIYFKRIYEPEEILNLPETYYLMSLDEDYNEDENGLPDSYYPVITIYSDKDFEGNEGVSISRNSLDFSDECLEIQGWPRELYDDAVEYCERF